jgi:tRNA threonylcarbamoyladenosine modification (KEOPS) complex Cgi121 subunit
VEPLLRYFGVKQIHDFFRRGDSAEVAAVVVKVSSYPLCFSDTQKAFATLMARMVE